MCSFFFENTLGALVKFALVIVDYFVCNHFDKIRNGYT